MAHVKGRAGVDMAAGMTDPRALALACKPGISRDLVSLTTIESLPSWWKMAGNSTCLHSSRAMEKREFSFEAGLAKG